MGEEGIVSKTSTGLAHSVSGVSDTLYSFLKNVTGRNLPNDFLDHPTGFRSGLDSGVKGLVSEVGSGISGVFTVPHKRIHHEGTGFLPATKGVCKGVVGLFTSPFSGCIRCINSCSNGIKCHTGGAEGTVGWVRYPRFIDSTNDVLTYYDLDLSHNFTFFCLTHRELA